jgi:hypothetical protein
MKAETKKREQLERDKKAMRTLADQGAHRAI